MPRIAIRISGDDKTRMIDLAPDEIWLVGRHPDAARLPSDAPPRQVRHLEIADAPTVSQSHAALWLDGDRVVIMDASSKNGSWVRLHKRQRISVDGPGEVTVRLGAMSGAHGETEAPGEAEWATERDFAPSVLSSLGKWLRERQVDARVMVTAVQPGTDRLELPFDVPLADGSVLQMVPQGTADERWSEVLGEVWRYVSRQNARYQAEEDAVREGLVLASPAIRAVHAQVVEAARAGRRLLLLGPSGAGKEGLARCYHRHSGRQDGSFVARSCATLRPELLHSELFGAEAGAYTGSVKTRIGAVERAHGGTLFLDEIGDAHPDVQRMLLRFLDHGEFHRLGSNEMREADVRIVCATNHDLKEAIGRGEFREELWYRISTAVVRVPPLRERPEDLVGHLRMQRLGGGTSAFAALAPEAIGLLLEHAWGGNFRELNNFVARLPPRAETGSVSAQACRDLLELGSLTPTPPGGQSRTAPRQEGAPGWPRLMERALVAFGEDYEGRAPSTWDDVKEHVEKYLKPLMFVDLAGLGEARSLAEVEIPEVAAKLDADRGTVQKQLKRYFERFLQK